MRTWLVAGWAAAAGCVVVPGNGGGDTTIPDGVDGQVQVSWKIGSSSCEEAGITDVEVKIAMRSETFACTDLQGAVAVPAGVYGLQLIGYDAEALPRYGAEVEGIAVYEGQVTSVDLMVLSSLPANISATWYFSNGRLCGANGVSDIDIRLFDLADNEEASLQAPCDDGAAFVGEVEAGDYVLVLSGLDDQGASEWSGQVSATVSRGESAVLDVQLLPDAPATP